jgi:hypothetical protein
VLWARADSGPKKIALSHETPHLICNHPIKRSCSDKLHITLIGFAKTCLLLIHTSLLSSYRSAVVAIELHTFTPH